MKYLVTSIDGGNEPIFIEAVSLEEAKSKLAWHIAQTEEWFKEDFECKIANGAVWDSFVWDYFDNGELAYPVDEFKSLVLDELAKTFPEHIAEELHDYYFNDKKTELSCVSDEAILHMSLYHFRGQERFYLFTEQDEIKVI